MVDKLKLKINDDLYEAIWWVNETKQRPEYGFRAGARHVVKKTTEKSTYGTGIKYEISGGASLNGDDTLEDFHLFTTKDGALEHAKQKLIERLNEMKKIDTSGLAERIQQIKKQIKSANNPNRTARYQRAINEINSRGLVPR